jgi:peptide/nickel transport system permease protein
VRALWTRAAFLAAALWLIVSIAFVSVYALPGDPARLVLGQRATREALATFRIRAGLEEPFYRRYLAFLGRTVRLDFGDSLVQRRPVKDLIIERAPQTVGLVLAAMASVLIFSFLLPVLLRLCQACAILRVFERFWAGVAVAPPYVLAVAALVVFAGWLNWVPAIFQPGELRSWVLPALVLASYPTAIILRLFHQQLEDALSSTYVLRARAMGFPEWQILLREVLPNALTTALAALANGLAFFVTGTFFVEVVFGISGLGGLTYEAIRNKDIALLVGLCMVFAVTITAISVALEVVLRLLNPRLREAYA